MADKIGVQLRTWQAYKADDRAPKYETLIRICRLFGVTPNDLLGYSAGMPVIRGCVRAAADILGFTSPRYSVDDLAALVAATYEAILDDPARPPEEIAYIVSRYLLQSRQPDA